MTNPTKFYNYEIEYRRIQRKRELLETVRHTGDPMELLIWVSGLSKVDQVLAREVIRDWYDE